MFYRFLSILILLNLSLNVAFSNDFSDCMNDISYVGKDIIEVYQSLEDKEYVHAIHYTVDAIHELGQAVKPCHIEQLDNTLEQILEKFNVKEPDWVEEWIHLWIDMSDNASIFDFLEKIEPLCHNPRLKEVVDFLLQYQKCIVDLDDDIHLILDIVKAYEEKNVIGFIKNTKMLISEILQTYVECKNELDIGSWTISR